MQRCKERESDPSTAQGVFDRGKSGKSHKRGPIFALCHTNKTAEIDLVQRKVTIFDGYNGENEIYPMQDIQSDELRKAHGKDTIRGVLHHIEEGRIHIGDIQEMENPYLKGPNPKGSPPMKPQKTPPPPPPLQLQERLPLSAKRKTTSGAETAAPRKKKKGASAQLLPLNPAATRLDDLPPLTTHHNTKYSISRKSMPESSFTVENVTGFEEFVAVVEKQGVSPPYVILHDDFEFDEAAFEAVNGKVPVVHLMIDSIGGGDFDFDDVVREAESDALSQLPPPTLDPESLIGMSGSSNALLDSSLFTTGPNE